MVNDEIVRKIIDERQVSTSISTDSFRGVTYPKLFEQMVIEYLCDTVDVLKATGNEMLLDQATCIAQCIGMKHDAEKKRREYRREY